MGRAIGTGFGQVSENKKVREYFFEGNTIAIDRIYDLSGLLTEEGIPIPSTSDFLKGCYNSLMCLL